MKLRKNTSIWIRLGIGFLGILGLCNELPKILIMIQPGLPMNYAFFIFSAILGLWVGCMLFIYRKKALVYRRILEIMVFLSLGLYVFTWVAGNSSLMNKNSEVYSSLLLALGLIALIIDPSGFDINAQSSHASNLK